MKNVRDAGFSRKRGGNAGSGPPLPDPLVKSHFGAYFQENFFLRCITQNDLELICLIVQMASEFFPMM